MSKRSCAVSVAYSIGLLALTVALNHPVVHAQPADLALCDRVAADPTDPDKPADVRGHSRSDRGSDIATAIRYCKVASAKSRRALYQLGRAYAANRQMPEAMSAYRKAADKGSTSAMVELGVMFGTGSGVPKDEDQARTVRARGRGRQPPRGYKSRGAGRRAVRSRQGEELCCRKRRRQIPRKRSISSD